MALIGQAVSEEKIFEIVDGRRTDGRMPDHGHPISSPCEPNGSGELTSIIYAFSLQSVSTKPTAAKGNHLPAIELENTPRACVSSTHFRSKPRDLKYNYRNSENTNHRKQQVIAPIGKDLCVVSYLWPQDSCYSM